MMAMRSARSATRTSLPQPRPWCRRHLYTLPRASPVFGLNLRSRIMRPPHSAQNNTPASSSGMALRSASLAATCARFAAFWARRLARTRPNTSADTSAGCASGKTKRSPSGTVCAGIPS